MIIIDGKKLAEDVLQDIKKDVKTLKFQPIFCDVLVGDDPASVQYVKIKAKKAESVGIKFKDVSLPATISTEGLIKEIKNLNKTEDMCGIIVQLPLPAHIDKQAVLDAIDPILDVDCLGTAASNRFYEGRAELAPPAALASMFILDSLKLDLKKRDKKIVVLGQGQLVGKPITNLLNMRGITPSVVVSDTKDKDKTIKEADIIISGMGNGKYINSDMIKTGAILIDAGTSESNDSSSNLKTSIVGDVDLESVSSVAGFVSPVPGGVGPVTVAMLLKNVLTVAKSFDTLGDVLLG